MSKRPPPRGWEKKDLKKLSLDARKPCLNSSSPTRVSTKE